eukprot:TRINITY_DN19748_c0_g1_i1.p1 TRINITY_DN19748_c0_g1~~TRINITY_DN19748_c0_g1_i1.p1  ORF type:complete len:251 (+),score=-4.91 TRINITY_DN19748_c0_g1_i1:2-754(+)
MIIMSDSLSMAVLENDKEMMTRLIFTLSVQYTFQVSEYSAVIGMLYLSDPRPEAISFLLKYCNLDEEYPNNIVVCSIISLGLIGFGTNNSRISDALKYLLYASFESDACIPAAIRIAQGMLHFGRGLFMLQRDEKIYLKLYDFFRIICDDSSKLKDLPTIFRIFEIINLATPKWIVGVNENGEWVNDIKIRIGKENGDIGKSRISGGLIGKTPVIKNYTEEAEIADERFEDIGIKKGSDFIYGNVVILNK